MRIEIKKLRKKLCDDLLPRLEGLPPVDVPWDAYWDVLIPERYQGEREEAPGAYRGWLSRDWDDIKDIAVGELAGEHLVQISNLLRAVGDYYLSKKESPQVK